MVWTTDLAFLEGKLLAGVSSPLDFFLYGVDLIEILAIINITLTVIAVGKHRKKGI